MSDRDLERILTLQSDGPEATSGIAEVDVTFRLPGGAVTYRFMGDIVAMQQITWEVERGIRTARVGMLLAGVTHVRRSGEAVHTIDVF